MNRGIFISFEGGEGAGKTTQIALLADRLRAAGREIVATREPGGTELGAGLRRFLVTDGEDPPCPRAELLLYAADRAHHVERLILPALGRGAVVLCDRYADATEAYQGWGRRLDLDLVRTVNEAATGGLWPHRTVWIDVDPAEGVRRSLARQSGAGETAEVRFEAEERAFHERVRQGYGALASAWPERFRRVDGGGTVAEVAGRIWGSVADLFTKAGT